MHWKRNPAFSLVKSSRTTLHYVIQKDGARDLVLPPLRIIIESKKTPWLPLASFPGRRRNGLATSASSNCIRLLRHGNCTISLRQTSARDTYNFSSCENGAFLLVEATVCCPFYYWSEIKVVRTKIVVQSAYTSAIERSIEMEWAWLRRFNALRNWGCTVVMWLRSEIWLVLPTFRQRK